MPSSPTASLTTPAAITAVSSARQSLTVTYSLGTTCSRLLITVPHVGRECECAFVFSDHLEGTHEFAILEDEQGTRYCDPGPWHGVPSNRGLLVHFSGITPDGGLCMTEVDLFNDANGFPVPLEFGQSLCENCNVPQSGGGYVWSSRVATGSIGCENPSGWAFEVGVSITKSADTYTVEVVIASGENHQNIECRFFDSGRIEGAIWSSTIPSVYVKPYPILITTNATASITAAIDYYRLRPTFDEEGNLASVLVEATYDEDDPEPIATVATYTPEQPAGCSALSEGVTLSGGPGVVFPSTITASVTDGMDVATIGTGDLRVTGPLGYDEIARFDSGGLVGGLYVATYSIPPPEGSIWCWQYNGTYTVSMVADQVADEDGNYVEAGTLGAFLCSIDGEPILEPLFLAGYLMAATETLVFPMYADDETALVDDATPAVLIRTTGGSWVAPASGPTNDGHGYYSVTVTSAAHFATYGTLHLLATAAGCRPTTQAYKAGPIAADTQAIDGDFDAAEHEREDIEDGYERGEVVSSADYSGSGYGCTASTTEFCTTLPLRDDSTEIGTSGLYNGGYARHIIRLEGDAIWKVILKSETYNGYTKITLALALAEAPADGTHVTVGGCTEPETAEA